ncbi:MAG: 8-oxo-dGTP pyrophosphatase MutT (NUDIX family) [Candidatus Azotimanducaceae bacterium]|jgi:8-oxo-dGTP pyrophosphatase MutT (NUDIX family)
MPHRQPLLTLIDSYSQQHPDEAATTARIRNFVTEQRLCFQRQLAMGHITGSAWLIDQSQQRVLLTHHRKLNIWVQLGGHADGESDVARVAMNEAEEESGLLNLHLVSPNIFDIDIHAIPARGDEVKHWHYDCRFLVQATGAEDYVVSDESHDLAWIELANVASLSSEPSLLRMVAKTRIFFHD